MKHAALAILTTLSLVACKPQDPKPLPAEGGRCESASATKIRCGFPGGKRIGRTLPSVASRVQSPTSRSIGRSRSASALAR